jgi:hypothetical protein
MANLYNDLMKYKDWTGNREEFLITVSQLEELNAEDCMLKSSKAPYNLLPVNLRRIQWFASNNIIPPAVKRMYDFEHLVYYMHAILLRKKGKLTFKQIAKQIENFTFNEALGNLSKGVDQQKKSAMLTSSSFLGKDEEIYESLRKLGREEGRPLKSTLTRFAITPWCHVTINEKYTRNLTKDDADVLSSAFRNSLSDLVKN